MGPRVEPEGDGGERIGSSAAPQVDDEGRIDCNADHESNDSRKRTPFLSSSDKRSADPWNHSEIEANLGICERRNITVWALGSSPRVTAGRELAQALPPKLTMEREIDCRAGYESDRQEQNPSCRHRTSFNAAPEIADEDNCGLGKYMKYR